MLKKLRNKLLILLMTMISAVMLIAFAVIYLSIYANVQQERDKLFCDLSARTYCASLLLKNGVSMKAIQE